MLAEGAEYYIEGPAACWVRVLNVWFPRYAVPYEMRGVGRSVQGHHAVMANMPGLSEPSCTSAPTHRFLMLWFAKNVKALQAKCQTPTRTAAFAITCYVNCCIPLMVFFYFM